MTLKQYVITLNRFEDLEDFYNDMETPGGSLYIPDRSVEVADRRPISRNTHYYLSDEEAELLRGDPRILNVELTPEELGITVQPAYTQTSNSWDKSGTINNAMRNWGLYRCTQEQQPNPNWGDYFSATNDFAATPSISGTIDITSSGKNVDVIIVDGHINPNHPEFAVNSDGTGGSRVIQFNWFSLNLAVTGGLPSNYVYTPYVDNSIAGLNADNDHGCHVAGTVAGNTQGWARDANIYNINPYSTNNNIFSISTLFDYIREFHRSKPINPLTGRKNPTVVNNSWGFGNNNIDISSVIQVTWRNQTITGPFTGAQLATYGINSGMTKIILPARVFSVDADIQDAINEGIVIIGAAGNDRYKIDQVGGTDYNNSFRTSSGATYFYHRGMTPTSTANAICVGAIGISAVEEKAFFSNSGPRIDLYAPGENIISSVNSTASLNTYDFRNDSYFLSKFSGTSMASPQVCGVVACLLETYPNLNQSAVIQYIQSVSKLNQITDNQANDYANSSLSLQGSVNRYLYYKKERPSSGQTYPKVNAGLRQITGQTYPRPRIYTYGK